MNNNISLKEFVVTFKLSFFLTLLSPLKLPFTVIPIEKSIYSILSTYSTFVTLSFGIKLNSDIGKIFLGKSSNSGRLILKLKPSLVSKAANSVC